MKPAKHARGEAAAPIARVIDPLDHHAFADDDALPPPPLRVVNATPPSDPPPRDAYEPAHLKPRHDGWTAQRQRIFLTVLAETGSISMACIQAGVSSRSAYRLRAHPKGAAFAQAWDMALKLATARLTALAYERATRGTVKETWVEGELKTSTRAPSDKLLMSLLQHLLPAGRPGDRWTGFEAMATEARTSFPDRLADLTDQAIEMVPIDRRDFFDEPPGNQDEDA